MIAQRPQILACLHKAFPEPTEESLLRKYLCLLQHSTKLSKLQRQQEEYSSVLYLKNTKQKYLAKMVHAYNDIISSRDNEARAELHYTAQTTIKVWNGLKQAVRVQKFEDKVQVNRNRELCILTFQGFASNIQDEIKKRKLNALMSGFVKGRSKHVLKHGYYTWKHHYELESYYKKAVNEFQAYSKTLQKRRVLKAFQMEIKVIKLEEKAKNYFKKKHEFKCLKSVFSALYKNAQKEIFTKTGKADQLADQYRLQSFGKQ